MSVIGLPHSLIQTGMTVVTGGLKEGQHSSRHRHRLLDAWTRGIVVGKGRLDEGCEDVPM